MSQYILGSGRWAIFFVFGTNFSYRKSIKIIKNTLKIEKFSDVPKKFGVGPKKEGSVGFPETRHFFFFFGLKSSLECIFSIRKSLL